MARKAEFGPKIYEIVEREAVDGVTKTDVFQRISQNKERYGLEKMTGKSAGTVAASYYRVARQQQKPPQGKADDNGNDNDNDNGRDASASATVPPINQQRPGVRMTDNSTSEALAQELTAKIQAAVEAAVAPLIAERDEAVARLKQIQAAFGQE